MQDKKSFSDSYKSAGVDIEAGYKAVQLMGRHVERTKIAGVMSALGGFGGLFELDINETPHPVLVSGTDGVGTKLRIAFILDRHNTVGIDCVAMCVNDIICSGARPLVFLDYIACGKNIPSKIASIVEGVAEGCVQAGCALIGGETAEMPGFYSDDEYDLAGFSTGVVDKSKIFNNSAMCAGDVLIALPSSGVHSNGFSLVRKIFNIESSGADKILNDYKSVLGISLGEELLTPTKIYVKPVLELAKKITVLGVSHITGGGFFENIPRSFPCGLSARIKKSDVIIPPIFKLIGEKGNVNERDLFNTFNMGVGMVVVIKKEDVNTALSVLKDCGAYLLGEVIKSDCGVELV
jgi:phosphoribosylformylglycinamidine cyclo-ligase